MNLAKNKITAVAMAELTLHWVCLTPYSVKLAGSLTNTLPVDSRLTDTLPVDSRLNDTLPVDSRLTD